MLCQEIKLQNIFWKQYMFHPSYFQHKCKSKVLTRQVFNVSHSKMNVVIYYQCLKTTIPPNPTPQNNTQDPSYFKCEPRADSITTTTTWNLLKCILPGPNPGTVNQNVPFNQSLKDLLGLRTTHQQSLCPFFSWSIHCCLLFSQHRVK